MIDPSKQPRRKAVALRYDRRKDQAPRVIAKGTGLLAERIIALAREHGVRVHEDPELVALLSKLDISVEIPEDLYRAVAEVLAFLYRLDRRAQ
ncbi:MAG TPA: EscU/YscU/HrcU family type III secretion system export apparatus switch protein [Candidatus Hydrogenedentes bacterium]|nr:EscU/YscU/HrcU family type III secretion system export apparatus switch protein [Candidatus Hydrogenedentota bacterium]HOS03601.1 EscU/YscU/HrcU family type III secretion system export apparatus switch protein [Candidatus Hydrogenedentota bacterium]